MREDISGFRLPRYEQTLMWGCTWSRQFATSILSLRRWGEVELTASMASNYVKHKLLPAPRKKLYSAEQLARLMFIAAVKPVVPLDGLRLMFSIQAENYEIQTAYDYFCDEFENMLGAAFGVAPAMQGIGETESDEKDLLRNTITAVVNKVYLDRYLAFYREAQDAAPSEQE